MVSLSNIGGNLTDTEFEIGGTLSIILQPRAPSLSFLGQQMEAVLGGGIVNWEGSVRDAKHGSVLRLMHGVMTSVPMGTLMDEAADKTFTFEFERLYYEVI